LKILLFPGEVLTMRRKWLPLTLLAATAALSLAIVKVGRGGGEEIGPRARIGLQVAPLPLNLRGKDPQLVGLGSYYVNSVADCNGCHSTQEYATGFDPFLGQPKRVDTARYLRGGQAFGPFISRNIRPEIGTGLPAGLTYTQFLSVIRHGTDFDNPGQLLQVMPWPAFQDMAEVDLRAIYLYLLSLPPVPPGG
jgi:hypothetical protein